MPQYYTLGIPFGETISYGKANLAKLDAYRTQGGITPAQVMVYFQTNYKLSSPFITSVYGAQTGDIYETSTSTSAASALAAAAASPMYQDLHTLADDTTDLITTDVTMQILMQFENALQTAANVRSRFTKEINAWYAQNPTSDAYSSSNRPGFYNNIMQSVYNNYYNDGTDISMYELKTVGTTTPHASFNDL